MLMKTIRISFATLAAFAITGLTFSSEALTVYALEMLQLSWMQSYLLPRLLVVLLAIASIFAVLPVLNLPKIMKSLVGILILGAAIGSYLSVNLPYVNDWVRVGTALNQHVQASEIGNQLKPHDQESDGLFMLALPSCPYCVEQFETLERLAVRNPDLIIAVFVAGADSVSVNEFKNHVGKSQIPMYPISNPNEISELSEGRFPTFLYYRNGSVVYRWSNQQFGYPALDWVEAGLE